jgi:subtilase family serine protease
MARVSRERNRLRPAALLALAAAGTGASCGGGGGGSTAAPATGVDLVAESITPTAWVLEAGNSVTVSAEVTNVGTFPAEGFQVGVYLSPDPVLDPLDLRLLSWSLTTLPAGETFAASEGLQVPVTTTPGDYYLLCAADDLGALGEAVRGNNVVATTSTLLIEEARHPDLVAESVTFGAVEVQAGQAIPVDDTVRNVGLEPSGAFRVGVYLSTDTLVTPSDVLIGQRQVLGLEVGEADPASGSLTVPAFVAAGTYHVGVLVDDLGSVVEMDELNNDLAAPGTLSVTSAPEPDLAASSITFSPPSVEGGESIVVDEVVINQGLAAAALFQVGVYLSDDPDIDPATDLLVGARTATALAVGGASASGPTSLPVPASTPPGEYFVGVYADSTALLVELDEGNNGLLAVGRLTVSAPPLSDLAADQFTFSPSAVQSGTGAVIQVEDHVVNLGLAPSSTVRVAVYLSNDAAITTNDVLLGFHELSPLGIGVGSTRALAMPVPGGIAPGSYRVGLWVDDLNTEPELDEGNNLLVAGGLLDVLEGGIAAPNLVSELIDPALMTAEPGQSFQVVTRVANSGDASCGGFRIGLYLSDDETITTSDTLLGDRLVPFGLGASFASVASAPVSIPAGTPEGEYTIGVLADWQGVVSESDETDNALGAAGTFRVRIPPPPAPDLTASDVDVIDLSPFSPGEVIQVAHTVRNGGDLAAGSFRVGIYLSADELIDPAEDTLLGSRVLASLDVGSSSSANTTVQIPPGTASAAWRIGVLVDDLGALAEGDESNNSALDPEAHVIQ